MDKDIKFYHVNGDTVEIEQHKFVRYINSLGIWRYYPDRKNFIFVIIKNSIIKELAITDIKNIVLDDLDSVLRKDKEKIIEKIHRMIPTLFGKPLLETLKDIKISMLKDTRIHSFVFFNNCYFKITEDEIVPHQYDSLPGPIWKSRKLDRNIMDPDQVKNLENSVFEQFIDLICGGIAEKKSALCSNIGYLLHGYKNPVIPKAVIFIDRQPDKPSSIPNGRTGKGLLISAISQFKKVSKEDGKLFSPKSNFPFQQVCLDTEILWIDDIKPDFDFLKLFSVISEGIQIEKKYQDKFSIPYKESPKVVLTSNYVLPGVGESYKGRQIEFSLERYFHAKYNPNDEFGHLFFDDWDIIEWARFDYFMMGCIRHFLKNGIVDYHEPLLSNNRLEDMSSHIFAKFCAEKLELNKSYDIKNLYLAYQEFAGDNVPVISQNTFTRYLKKFSVIENLEIKDKPSNGKRFIIFLKKVE